MKEYLEQRIVCAKCQFAKLRVDDEMAAWICGNELSAEHRDEPINKYLVVKDNLGVPKYCPLVNHLNKIENEKS